MSGSGCAFTRFLRTILDRFVWTFTRFYWSFDPKSMDILFTGQTVSLTGLIERSPDFYGHIDPNDLDIWSVFDQKDPDIYLRTYTSTSNHFTRLFRKYPVPVPKNQKNRPCCKHFLNHMSKQYRPNLSRTAWDTLIGISGRSPPAYDYACFM